MNKMNGSFRHKHIQCFDKNNILGETYPIVAIKHQLTPLGPY